MHSLFFFLSLPPSALSLARDDFGFVCSIFMFSLLQPRLRVWLLSFFFLSLSPFFCLAVLLSFVTFSRLVSAVLQPLTFPPPYLEFVCVCCQNLPLIFVASSLVITCFLARVSLKAPSTWISCSANSLSFLHSCELTAVKFMPVSPCPAFWVYTEPGWKMVSFHVVTLPLVPSYKKTSY